MDNWVEVPPTGTLVSATVAHEAFLGGPEAPYGVGAIRLDGTDTLFLHHIGGFDLSDPELIRTNLAKGARMQAVWAEERSGTILDILHFTPVPT
jgi:uncharacterized OB-fold protein